MIYPSIAELTKDKDINRYTLVIAAAKSARVITDEYVKQREYAEKLALTKDADKGKTIASRIKKEYRDDKAVKLAVDGLYSGEFRIVPEDEMEEAAESAEATVEETVEAEGTDTEEEAAAE